MRKLLEKEADRIDSEKRKITWALLRVEMSLINENN